MSDAYSPNEAVADTEKAVWDAVKSKTKVFITKNLKKETLPKIKGCGIYTHDESIPSPALISRLREKGRSNVVFL